MNHRENIAGPSGPTLSQILWALQQLNRAHQAYALALPAELRRQIASVFSTHYRWLLREHVNFGFDTSQQLYFLHLPAITPEDNNS
ncbi:hypothetical protein EPA93_07790 [Ktedonosporobacter rubrisoli]|uniref:Uncharacterized protein n=1 Tax=Ktedonosporobacter rubrisoli TaxID=2509675 RepID=A0A4P6JMK0_KTERU|nr:hypothetical protein [Ktedonosporobacter rubrisoli]QBD75916.1 hypothetical protein EPA93_07790 [Ktedonosporobacter rubrisoli]